MNQRSNPPEEAIICAGLINEIAYAQTWEQVVAAARALLNMRRLAEQRRIRSVPTMPPPQEPLRSPTLESQPPPEGGYTMGETAEWMPPWEREDEE